MTEQPKPDCKTCVNVYQGADLCHRCRRNGLLASEANAEDCKHWMRETGADDVVAWCA